MDQPPSQELLDSIFELYGESDFDTTGRALVYQQLMESQNLSDYTDHFIYQLSATTWGLMNLYPFLHHVGDGILAIDHTVYYHGHFTDDV